MNWASQEMSSINLGDKRLNQRVVKVLSDLAGNPTESIPTACGSWRETKAAYRLFDNNKVNWEKLLAPHEKAALERIKSQNTVLLLQDTTSFCFSKQRTRQDVGPITHSNVRGMFLHTTLAVTPQRLCLGVLSPLHWFRTEISTLSKKEKTRANKKKSFEEKESYRWLLGYRFANQIAQKAYETTIVTVSDREGDIYEIFQEAQETVSSPKAYWLIRSCHERASLCDKGIRSKTSIKIATKNEPPLGYIEFDLSPRIGKSGRRVRQSVHIKKLRLSLPEDKVRRTGYSPVEVTVISAHEIGAPEGEKPIEWTLLTNLPVETFEEACEKIQWYTCRWEIEIFFKILKSGCKIENLQLSEKNFSSCLSVYMVVAWRVMYLLHSGRVSPNVSCEFVFTKEEWTTAFIMVKKKKPPLKPPTLNSVVKMIASLGGYMNRNNDPNPGPKNMWIGLNALHEYVRARKMLTKVYNRTYG